MYDKVFDKCAQLTVFDNYALTLIPAASWYPLILGTLSQPQNDLS